jgi:alpha-glucosidase (family GH31 glycosyl hydrolase)
LNENAQAFWSDLYSAKNFRGTNNMWGIWNDMNEPSVFINNLEQRGMPVHNIHVDKSGN